MSVSLNILQVLRAPVGGLFRHVVDLTEGLADRGHAVGLVIEASDPGAYWSAKITALESVCRLGVTRIPMARGPSARDLLAIAHVKARLSAQNIDIVHGHGAKGGAYARFAGSLARHKGKPARFYTPHGGTLHFAPNSLQGRSYQVIEHWLARSTEAVIFESAFARDSFANRFALSAPHWPVVHNGLNAQEFEDVAPLPDAADFVFVGEMRAIKGVDLLIDALAKLPGRPTAILVGAGPDKESYQHQAATLGLTHQLTFLDPMPARQAFALGRVVVAPSRAESLPYLLLEALAACRPVIATRVGGIPEIFGPLETLLFKAGDSDALSMAMAFALGNQAILARHSMTLRHQVRTRFFVGAMVNAIEALYCSKLEQVKSLIA